MNRLRGVVYPYDIESAYFFRYDYFNKDFQVVGAVSPPGWGLHGNDVLGVCKEKHCGIEVVKSFNEVDEDFDTVILVDSYNDLDFNTYIFPKVKEILQKKKNLICTKILDNESKMALKKLCESIGVIFKYYNNETYNSNIIKGELYDINVPVIFIMSIASRTNKFDIQLTLKRDLGEMGYRTSIIGSKNHGEVFGMHNFPNFMFDDQIKESKKILMFNRLVKEIEKNENPDAIIIGVPEGIMPIGKVLNNNFGIIPYLVCNAVKPDTTILSLLYTKNYDKEYFEEVERVLKYKFDCNIDCYNLSNIFYDYQESENNNSTIYTIIDSDFIDFKKDKYKSSKPIFNILNIEDGKSMSKYITNILSNGEEII